MIMIPPPHNLHQARRNNVAELERLRTRVLNDADIVCTTLSFAGSGVLSQLERPFDVLVVDEAAQAVEPSLLVPLALGAKQIYLVGDPVQLPATVISNRAVEHNYEQSLFRCVVVSRTMCVVMEYEHSTKQGAVTLLITLLWCLIANLVRWCP